MEFYIFIPILAYLVKKFGLLIIFIFSLFIQSILFIDNNNSIHILYVLQYHLFGSLPEFMLGIILYKIIFLSKDWSQNKLQFFKKISIGLGILLIINLAFFFIKYGYLGLEQNKLLGKYFYVLSALSYAMILFYIIVKNQNKTRQQFNKTLLNLASISYPIYLIHNAMPKLFQSLNLHFNNILLYLFCLVFTILISILLSKYIEEPLRKYGINLSKKFNY